MTQSALTRITPRVTLYAALVLAVCWSAVRVAGNVGWWRPAWGTPESAVFIFEAIVAYTIALALCIHIAAEYRRSYWMRLAWLCFAVNAGISIVRHAIDNPMLNVFWPGYSETAWRGLAREVPIVFALSFMAVGIFAMARGLLQTRLGFRFERRDWAAIIGVVAILVAVIYFRHELSAARWKEMPLVLQAQVAVQILFAITAVGSIFLYRLSMQMGGGHLAAAMRCLIAYIVLRALLVLVSMVLLPGLFGIDADNFTTMLLYQCTPWLFTLAAVYRYQLTSNAIRQAAEWRIRDLTRQSSYAHGVIASEAEEPR